MYISRSTCVLLYVITTVVYFSSIANAQKVADGGIELLQTTSENDGPWGEPLTEFKSIINNPEKQNATGNFAIAGPNISAPASFSTNNDGSFSGFSNIDGWSWSVAIVADLPLTNASVARNKSNFYTGGKLTFNAPSSLSPSSSQDLSVDNDWQICVYTWSLWGTAYPNKLRSDDGSCTSVLSSQCVSDMEKAAAKSSDCACPISRNMPSCLELGNSSKLWDTTCAGRYFNTSAVRAWKNGKLDIALFGGATTHELGNNTDYNYIGSVAWPVMASFSSNNSVEATLSCPRAKDGVNRSTAPSGEEFKDAQNSTQQGDDNQGNSGQGGTKESSGSRAYSNWSLQAAFVALLMFML